MLLWCVPNDRIAYILRYRPVGKHASGGENASGWVTTFRKRCHTSTPCPAPATKKQRNYPLSMRLSMQPCAGCEPTEAVICDDGLLCEPGINGYICGKIWTDKLRSTAGKLHVVAPRNSTPHILGAASPPLLGRVVSYWNASRPRIILARTTTAVTCP